MGSSSKFPRPSPAPPPPTRSSKSPPHARHNRDEIQYGSLTYVIIFNPLQFEGEIGETGPNVQMLAYTKNISKIHAHSAYVYPVMYIQRII